MAASAEKILAVAGTEIGVKELPAGSNNVKYNTAYYGREINDADYAWCAVFVWWVFKMAGAPELYYGGKKTASCPTLARWYLSTGQFVTEGYRPGDIVFYRFDTRYVYQHVGIIESVHSDGTITAIEGNTSSASDASGGAVMRRIRPLSVVVGAGRPDYAEEKGTEASETAPDTAAAGTYRVTAKSGLNVRTGPGTGYAKLGALLSGAMVSVTGSAGGWYTVKYGGTTGYCSADYLEKTESAPAPAEEPDSAAARYRVTAKSGLNVRSGPGTGYAKLGALAYGSAVTVTGKSGGWYMTTYGGKTGYCSEAYLERI